MTVLLAVSVTARNPSGVRVGAVPLSVAAATFATVVVVGWAVALCGREQRRRLAAGCLWVGAGGVLPVAAAAPALPVFVRAALLAAAPLVVLGAAVVGTDWPAGTRRLRLVTGLVVAAVLTHLVVYDPFRDPACAVLCSPVSAPLASLVPVDVALGLVAALTAGAAVVGAAAVWRARPGTPVPVVVTALAGIALGGLAVAARWLPGLSSTSLGRGLGPGLLAAAVSCLGVLLTWASTYRTRRAVHAVVRQLGEAGSGPGELPEPVLAVQVATPEGRWVDLSGREVDGSATTGTTLEVLGPDVRLVMRGTAAAASGMVRGLGDADLVALSNARLAALTQAHQREVRESQRRIVAASDAERARIERDLHDGAQQRLVAAKLHLRLAQPGLPTPQAEQVAAAEQQVQDALERLRALAHGVFPRLLESDGLAAALEDLASRSPVPVRLDLDALRPVERDLPRDVSTALYAVVAASVQSMRGWVGSGALAVHAVQRPGRLLLRVEAPGVAPASDHAPRQDVADRVGAVGGLLVLADAAEGWTATAEVPCEWS
jgi:signal transduction histidine kinase